MDLITRFFHSDYYIGILRSGQGIPSFRLVLILSLISILVPVIQFYNFALPFARSLPTEVKKIVADVYPSELEIVITNGTVTTNVTEPYFVSVSNQTLERLSNFKINSQPVNRTRIITIDTRATSEEIDKYQSLALLTADSLVYYNDSKIETISLKDVQNFQLNKSLIDSQVSKFLDNRSVVWVILGLLLFIPLFIFLFTGLGYLLWFSWLALLLLLLTRIYRLPFTYSRLDHFINNLAFPITIVSILWNLIPWTHKVGDVSGIFYVITLAVAHRLLLRAKY